MLFFLQLLISLLFPSLQKDLGKNCPKFEDIVGQYAKQFPKKLVLSKSKGGDSSSEEDSSEEEATPAQKPQLNGKPTPAKTPAKKAQESSDSDDSEEEAAQAPKPKVSPSQFINFTKG